MRFILYALPLFPSAMGSLMGSICETIWEQTTLLQNEILCKKYNKRPYQFEMDKKFMRVVKLRDWPWKEIQQSRQNPPPFMVAGEVSIEKSKEFADLNPIETACGNLSSIEYNV